MFTRKEILERLNAQVNAGKPLLMFGAGIGLTAKCAEKGGADLIGIYSTAIYRMRGLPSVLAWLPYSNANEHLINMAKEILPAVR
ncbi:MAG: phosphoenolpyruvate hydrolase family protein, partial [Clostridiales bacterium]|nr:phosphoenolpyruvate hydrolase family protein [Clostridiales bacterium]